METNRVLHFDVSLGCTAEVLIGALSQLLDDVDCIKRGLQACNLHGIEPILRREYAKNASGVFIDFVLESGVSLKSSALRCSNLPVPLPKPGTRRPIWARRKKEVEDETKETLPEESSAPSFQQSPTSTLLELRQIIENSLLSPVPKAIATKTVDLLTTSLSKASGRDDGQILLDEQEGLRYLCEIVSFSQLIANLAPSSVSSTRVAHSTGNAASSNDTGWILVLTEDIPTLEKDWPAPHSDAVGLALLRTVTARYGARGESVLLKHGSGVSTRNSAPLLIARALLCAPVKLASRADTQTHQTPATSPLLEISATLGQGVDVAGLLRRLAGLGMKSIVTWQGFEGSTFPRLLIRGFMAQEQSHLAIEALLITGEATDVFTNNVEAQSLQHRIVAVPYGRGQTQQACKVTEWLWAGNVLRADPEANDLAMLVKSTGFAQEIVRADILAAWRKWRLR